MKKILAIVFGTLLFLLPIRTVNAATASFFTSGGGTVYVGTTLNVTVYANGSESYNGAQVTVNFSNLNYVGVSAASGWTCVGGPSRSGNTISSGGCVLLGSSATGSKALLNLTFRAFNSPSTGTISASGTIALADGSGTQVSGGGNTVTYSVVNPPPPPPSAPSAPTVTSTTHPVQDTWYNTPNLTLSWNKDNGVDGFSYILDTTPDTNPDDTIENANTTVSYTALSEGLNYFHIKAHNNVGFSGTTTYTIRFDTQPPFPFGIAKLENDTKDKYLIYFATNDASSGVDYFTVSVDGVDQGKQVTGYPVDKTVGTIEVTAFDKAGNKISESLVINALTPISATISSNEFNLDLKSVLLTLGVVLILAGLSLGIFFLYKRYKDQKKKPIT